jgi:hypothetical protein
MLNYWASNNTRTTRRMAPLVAPLMPWPLPVVGAAVVGAWRTGGSSYTNTRTPRNSSSPWPQCQVCLKIGHTTKNSWHHFDKEYVPDPRSAAATSGPGADTSWYTDSGATDHITGELDQFRYGHYLNWYLYCSHFQTQSCSKNVLHVPSTHKNLILVHRFTLDNDIFIEFHPYFFLSY